MELVLYDWGPSPFCLKVRMILEHKGLAYRRVPVLGPGILHVRRRGKIGKVPALEIDGRMVTDSTDIAHEIDRLVPSPPLLPEDGRQRALCHALEDWADEAFYFLGLWFQWVDPAGAAQVPQAFGGSPLGRAAYVLYRRRVIGQVRGHGTGRKPAERVDADLRSELDAVEGLLVPGPFLLGESPFLCDFAVAAQLVYLSRPPRSKALMAGRIVLDAYLDRMRRLRKT